ncbi:hypothetical protein HY495_00665 [Candidatus Woesearchaeota archaeon]|nr:hypothetical protein [Candidatus Woesearchaeota archaeon]
MKRLSKLTLPELALQAESIDDFVALAGQEGHVVKDEDTLLKQLGEEWVKYQLKKFKEDYRHFPLPDQLPHLETEKDGITYTVFGIVHGPKPSQPYLHIVKNTAPALAGLWEEGIRERFKYSSGISIPDHHAGKWKEYEAVQKFIARGVANSLLLPCALLLSPFGKSAKEIQKTESEEEKQELTQHEATSFFQTFPEQNFNFPLHLSLELAERTRPAHYTTVQRRSAYMAEFLRTWDNRAPSKTITAGAGHVTEIIHFLEKGTKDSQIVDLAQKDAELLNNDPREFHHFYQRVWRREGIANTSAFLFGLAAPYFSIGFFLF